MDFLASIDDGKVLFGRYPTTFEMGLLENIGVGVAVDLTIEDEFKTPLVRYHTNIKVISFPIVDRRCPNEDQITDLFQLLSYLDRVIETHKIYIHCRGGHGRSGVIAACVLMYSYHLTAVEALEAVKIAHSLRITMTPKMRKLGCPQTLSQKNFVRRIGNILDHSL